MAQQKDTKRGTWFFHGSCKDILGNTVRYCRRGFKTKKEAKEAEHLFRLQMEESGPTITLNELRICISQMLVLYLSRTPLL